MRSARGRSRSPSRWASHRRFASLPRAALVRAATEAHRGARDVAEAAPDGAAGLQSPLPGRGGGHRGAAWRLRDGQDGHRAVAGEVRRGRRRRLRGLRRAGQRDGRSPRRLRGTEGPGARAPAPAAHGARGEHVEHARRRARGLGAPRAHGRRVLPRHGVSGGADGGLSVALGGGAAGDRLAAARDAWRGGVPDLPREPRGKAPRARRREFTASAPPYATGRCRS